MFGLNLVQTPSAIARVVNWAADRVLTYFNNKVDENLHEIGARIVTQARLRAPYRTGALRDSIGYVVAGEGLTDHVLSIQVGMPYGIFQEFGTRNMTPHPFIRPAIEAVGKISAGAIQMDFTRPGGIEWHGLLATGPGFAAAAHPGWKPLTEKQLKHVKTSLIPTSKRLYRGNVKRATMRVRRIP
jgi:HK97 gp10 family phage protein